ncbi:MAG: NAD-dependent succinate-semialdehyde dehydrogenase [Nocardioides sp.]
MTGQFVVQNPATLEPIAEVPDLGVDEAIAAVEAAHAAFPSWSATPPRQRSVILHTAFELMIRDKDRLAALISQENGKSLTDAHAEVAYAAEFFRWFSEEAVRSGGDYTESPAGGTRTIVRHKPVGVAALVTPWNFPAAMATRKIGPALAAGCTAVLKPAEETPLTALAICELLREAGLPDGVLQIVTTTDAPAVVAAWLEDRRVRKISFTGSTGVGRQLLRQAADRVVNASMELGGNAPFVVADDADLDAAVTGAMIAKFRNGGQACTAANRFYVHTRVAEEFTTLLGAAIEKLVVGDAADGAAIGPLISARQLAGARARLDEAIAAGAHVAAQAQLPDLPGHFLAPTLLTGVAPDATVVTEELFAPIAPIVTWDDDEDLVRMVNDSEYGLAAYVFSGDLKRAISLSERIDAGMIGVNRGLVSDPAAPFGGVKQSGLGREGAREGLLAFLEPQYLSVDWS